MKAPLINLDHPIFWTPPISSGPSNQEISPHNPSDMSFSASTASRMAWADPICPLSGAEGEHGSLSTKESNTSTVETDILGSDVSQQYSEIGAISTTPPSSISSPIFLEPKGYGQLATRPEQVIRDGAQGQRSSSPHMTYTLQGHNKTGNRSRVNDEYGGDSQPIDCQDDLIVDPAISWEYSPQQSFWSPGPTESAVGAMPVADYGTTHSSEPALYGSPMNPQSNSSPAVSSVESDGEDGLARYDEPASETDAPPDTESAPSPSLPGDLGAQNNLVSDGRFNNAPTLNVSVNRSLAQRRRSPRYPLRSQLQNFGEDSTPRHPASSPRLQKCSGSITQTVLGADHGTQSGAKFEEWPLENVILKRITIGGQTTFQLQFGWNTCAGEHGSQHISPRQTRASNKTRVLRSEGSIRRKPRRTAFTPDEDNYLIELKEQSLSWSEIHCMFNTKFKHQRTQGALQVRYSTRLKIRSATDGVA